MTQPTLICFAFDVSKDGRVPVPKVYLRTLSFSTAKRGRVVESMHVALVRNETRQNFPFWGYGDDKLVRGSGLFVGENGVATNHHFLTLKSDVAFQFAEGQYQLTVFAKFLGVRKPVRLFQQTLELSALHALELQKPNSGVYFDWGPDAARYIAHTETHKAPVTPDDFFEFLKSMSPAKGNLGLPVTPVGGSN